MGVFDQRVGVFHDIAKGLLSRPWVAIRRKESRRVLVVNA